MVQTIIDKLAEHAATIPDAPAYVFLTNGHNPDQSLSYGELARRVGFLAGMLASRNLAGQRAVLLYPQGLDFIVAFLACLAAGVIAIPAPAPEAGRLKRTRPRLNSIVKDSGAVIALTNKAIIELIAPATVAADVIDTLELIDTTEMVPVSAQIGFPTAPATEIAYLQYTSGSTSTPKGVCIGNAGLLKHCQDIIKGGDYGPDAITVTWMPYFHDYGLVEGILVPLVNGTPCYLMSPFAFLRNPGNWLKAISRFHGTHSQGPTFAYRACVDRIRDADLENLDLSTWKYAAIAAEPVHAETIRAFQDRFAPLGFSPKAFSPCFGLAEYILLASYTPHDVAPFIASFDSLALKDLKAIPRDEPGVSKALVGCGYPLKETVVEIVDPETCARALPGNVGEVWLKVQDPQAGYWNNPAATRYAFEATLADWPDAGRFLRTGDMGFMYEGHVFLTGRLKDLIILNGENHWPQDVEAVVENCHEAVLRNNCCAAFAIEENGTEKLVVVLEVERRFSDYEGLYLRAVDEVYASLEVPISQFVIVQVGSVPKTSSGKISRRACKAALLDDALPVLWRSTMGDTAVSPDNAADVSAEMSDETAKITQWLCQEIAQLARIELSQVSAAKPIYSFGLDSHDLVQLSLAMEDAYEKSIPISEIGKEGRNIQGLVRILQSTTAEFSTKALVPLKQSGARAPIFLVHPAGGNVMGYSKLAHHLPAEHPVYGLQSYGFVEGVEPLQRVEDMAARYLDEIRGVQPKGPYHLGGMCLGGMIAYEIARMIEQSGETVAFLALIDPRNPPALLDMAMNSPDEFAAIVQTASAPDFEKLREEARAKPPVAFPGGIFASDPLSQAVQAGNAAARDIYLPAVYSGPVDFFWASKTPGDLGFFHDPRVCWTSLFKGEYAIHPLECDHFKILDEPNFSPFVRQISDILKERSEAGLGRDVAIPA